MRVKTVVLAGHLSDFGWAWWQSLLACPDLQIVAVYLAPLEDWWQFYLRLSRNTPTFSHQSLERKYRQRTQRLRQQLRQYPGHPPMEIGLPRPEVLVNAPASLLYTAAFPRIFSPAFCAALNRHYAFINTHPSFLPYCRGANPMYWTIAGRQEKAGITSHQVTADLDAGPLLVRDELPIDPKSVHFTQLKTDSYAHLPAHHQRVAAAISSEQQYFLPNESPTFFRQDQPQDRLVDWSQDWLQNDAKIRAGNAWVPFPGGRQMIQTASIETTHGATSPEWDYSRWGPAAFSITTKEGRINGTHFLIYSQRTRRIVNRLERRLNRFILPPPSPMLQYG